MPDPVPSAAARRPVDLDRAMHFVTDAREDVRLDRPVEDPAREPASLLGRIFDLRGGPFSVKNVAPLFGVGTTPLSYANLALAFCREMLEMWRDAHIEGDRQNRVFHRDRMIGALAYMAGYGDAPEVRARAASDPAFAEGLRRARAFNTSTANVDEALAIVHAVRALAREGERAVALGLDRGEAHERRVVSDPAYALGVEHMRALRDASPERFEARVDELRALDRRLDEGRLGAVRP